MTNQLSDERKEKMVAGRRETRIVDAYLTCLSRLSTKSQGKSADEIEAEAALVLAELETAAGTRRLELLQRREDLQVAAMNVQSDDLTKLEEDFIAVAASYAERKKISYSTWREFGVSREVLQAAKIRRTRRPYGDAS